MGKSNYERACDELKARIKNSTQPGRKSSCAYSSSDRIGLTTALLNSPEHEVKIYSMKTSGIDGSPQYTTKTPSKRHREALKSLVVQLGLDKNDAEKLNDMTLSKEYAASCIDVVDTATKDYMTGGRKMQYPITSLDEVRMETYIEEAPERINPNRFAKSDDERTKMTKTKKRMVIKARNSAVPSWLKEDC